MQLVLRDRQITQGSPITHGAVDFPQEAGGIQDEVLASPWAPAARCWGNQEATNTMLNARGSGQLAPSASVPPHPLLPVHPLPSCVS